MRISAIQHSTAYNSQSTKVNKLPKITDNTAIKLPMPSYQHYIPFLGGYSLNLSESLENLEKLNVQFPDGVKEAAAEILDIKNTDDKTLIDIHKSVYKDLDECFDLNEVKEKYPQFRNVLSDKEVEYRDNSFIDDVKLGKNENFNKDEDLALQILKLYWAQGFSLNDLKEYCGGINLYHTMNKFRIPLMDRNYAHILKLSDKQYNERLTKQMAQKRMETRDRLAQQNNGEPVYIPKGPMSDERKKHISEGLIKHYAQHPEKLDEMSQKQKEYWTEHPEQREVMKRVMTYAWNETKEGKSIKKYMHKFFKKNGVKLDEEILTNSFAQGEKKNSRQKELFKQFWNINKWAHEQLSAAVSKGWEVEKKRENEQNKEEVELPNILPHNLYMDVLRWSLKTYSDDFLSFFIENHQWTPEALEPINSIFNEYNKHHPEAKNILTSSLAGAVMSLENDVLNDRLPKHINNDENFKKTLIAVIDEVFYPHMSRIQGAEPKIVSYDEMEILFARFGRIAHEYNHPELNDYIGAKVDKSYELLEKSNTVGGKLEFLKFIGKDQI